MTHDVYNIENFFNEEKLYAARYIIYEVHITTTMKINMSIYL
jgi:hypothetical protein